jgi:hypothetical protein
VSCAVSSITGTLSDICAETNTAPSNKAATTPITIALSIVLTSVCFRGIKSQNDIFFSAETDVLKMAEMPELSFKTV